jgi:hypothetical protein
MSIADRSSGHAILKEDVVTHQVALISTSSPIPIMVVIGIGWRAERSGVACKTGAHVGLDTNSPNFGRESGRAPLQARGPSCRQQERAGVARAVHTSGGGNSEILVSLEANLEWVGAANLQSKG